MTNFTSEWLRTLNGNYCQVEFHYNHHGEAVCLVHHKRGSRCHPHTVISRHRNMTSAIERARARLYSWLGTDQLSSLCRGWKFHCYRLDKPVLLARRIDERHTH